MRLISFLLPLKKKGMTLVPTKMYFNKKGLAKISIGVGKFVKFMIKEKSKKLD